MSYHGVEYPEEDDTAVQFLDGGHQSHNEEEEKEGREKQKDNVIDPNTVCVVSCVGGEGRDVWEVRGEMYSWRVLEYGWVYSQRRDQQIWLIKVKSVTLQAK